MKAIDWKCSHCGSSLGSLTDDTKTTIILTNPTEIVFYLYDGVNLALDTFERENPLYICEYCRSSLDPADLPEDLHTAKNMDDLDV